MEKTSKHKSVLLEESMTFLSPKSGEKYLDCTFGGGGHSRKILELSTPGGKVVGLDRDSNVAEVAETLSQDFPNRFRFENISYEDLGSLDETFDGVIFDLGLSSDQLEQSGRGFSFMRDEPLDMRFNDQYGQTAAQFLMQSSATRLEQVFREYGEDRYAKRLAVKITQERRHRAIRTTTDFIRLVGTENPKVLAPLFQALRIEVNDELQVLRAGLKQAFEALNTSGRLVVISFHSLEDRIVKDFMRSNMKVLTKKPVEPSQEEINSNPRSRSAKLRAAIKAVEDK